jgi:hypothetical protein
MSHLTRTDAVFGTSFHVGDFYVWAEIFYLDSPTDFREYLPERGRTRTGFGQFTTLDDSSGFLNHAIQYFSHSLKRTFQRIRRS